MSVRVCAPIHDCFRQPNLVIIRVIVQSSENDYYNEAARHCVPTCPVKRATINTRIDYFNMIHALPPNITCFARSRLHG